MTAKSTYPRKCSCLLQKARLVRPKCASFPSPLTPNTNLAFMYWTKLWPNFRV